MAVRSVKPQRHNARSYSQVFWEVALLAARSCEINFEHAAALER